MKRKKYLRDKNHYYNSSYIEYLEKQNILTTELKNLIRKLNLEDLIVIKLELSMEVLKGRMFNLKLYQNLPNMVQEAVLRYAISAAHTTREAYTLLGITKNQYFDAMTKYGLFRKDDETGI